MDGGSAYGIGNTVSITGISTIANHTPSIIEIKSVQDCAGSVVKISGITSESLKKYNELYRIVGVNTGSDKEIKVNVEIL